MSTPAVTVPEPLARLQATSRNAAVAGLLALAVGLVLDPTQFFRSYLYGFLFWCGVAVGCLCLLMIQHLTGGSWGIAIRRVLEAGARSLAFAPLLFVPLLFGLPRVYLWAQADKVASDAILKAKAPYLNVPFFVGRAAVYFVAWWLLARALSNLSLEHDANPSLRLERKMRGISGGGLLLMGMTITFASVDWAMSLDPHWFSTVWGVLFMVGWVLNAFTLVIVIVSRLSATEPLSRVVNPGILHDLGKLMLAFVMLWAYIHLSQFLIIWSGNLPEEIPWYLHRMHGGWQYLALFLVLFHFALPFLLLLSRDLKRKAGALSTLASALFVMRLLDLYWLLAPNFHTHGLRIHWLDVMAVAGLGGVWLMLIARNLASRPLVPMGEPEVRELLERTA